MICTSDYKSLFLSLNIGMLPDDICTSDYKSL